jgi:transmembrane sensor
MSDGQGTVAVSGDRWCEALDWHTRLGEASETELPHDKIHAWQEWVSDEQNRLVFDQLSRLLEDRAHYRRRRLPSPDDIDNDTYDPVVPLARWRQARAVPAAQRSTTREMGRWRGARLVAVAATVVVVLFGLLATLIPQSLWQAEGPNARPQVHQTASGEIRSLPLEDGSSVILGAQSAISVQFSAERRSVRLDHGEAWFKVAHNPARPFVVTAGARTITAVGTAFVVQRDSDRVVVTVTDGSVVVAPRSSADEHPFAMRAVLTILHVAGARVARGEQMSYEDAGSASAVEHADPQAATAWSEGRLEFDHESLRYVVQVVNRYSHRTITLDQASGDQLYTGLVLQDQIDEWIHGLERIFPVELIEQGDHVCVRSRDQAPVQGPSPCSAN